MAMTVTVKRAAMSRTSTARMPRQTALRMQRAPRVVVVLADAAAEADVVADRVAAATAADRIAAKLSE